MTNYERLKNMTVEETAVFLKKFCSANDYNETYICKVCPLYAGCGEDIDDWEAWLESEATENDGI